VVNWKNDLTDNLDFFRVTDEKIEIPRNRTVEGVLHRNHSAIRFSKFESREGGLGSGSTRDEERRDRSRCGREGSSGGLLTVGSTDTLVSDADWRATARGGGRGRFGWRKGI